MALAYQYDADGYYAGEIEDHGLLPNNATAIAPKVEKGFMPQWTGKKWKQVEDHKGKEGYLDGKPYTIADYGPLPRGWSVTLPEPTHEELQAKRKAEILLRLSEIDVTSVRPLRAVVQGEATQADKDKLVTLDAEADALRKELTALLP